MQNEKIYFERAKRLFDRVNNEIYPKSEALKVRYTHDPITPIPASELKSREWKDIKKDDIWAQTWACAWFIFEGEVPEEFKDYEVGVYLDIQGEACVFRNVESNSPNNFDLNKKLTPYTGLTNKINWSLQSGKFYVPLFKKAKGGEKISLIAEAGANGLFGKDKDEYRLERAEIVVYNTKKYQLMLDLKLLISLYEGLEDKTSRKKKLLFALNEICNNYQDGKGIDTCLEISQKIRSYPATASALTAWSIGHAHIDLAWLWPIRETKRKASRTFSTVLRMMEEYPEYKFGASQAQLYQWTKENYPELYNEIKVAIKAKRWEVQGATWVENDTNMPSGESLVRQCLYGKRFYQEEFGIELNYLWLPDCFGFTGSFPQILKQAGVDYFLSQKLSWNDTNQFPHHSFIWEGIDGSKIRTHFTPTNDYNFSNLPKDFIATEKRFQQADISDDYLNMYGIGDGGGGPSKEHIELALREQNLEGVSKVKFAFASDFIKALDKIPAKQLPVWKGEIYLELHRGTYTTQALMKKNNRKLENRLQQLEFLSAVFNDKQKEKLDSIWKDTLLNQFHDIIPGSSIGWVYKDAHALSEANFKKLDELGKDIIVKNFSDNKENQYLIINSQPWRRREIIELSSKEPVKVFTSEEKELPSCYCDGTVQFMIDLPSMGYRAIKLISTNNSQNCNAMHSSESLFENNYLRIELDSKGCISSIYDKEVHRETLLGKANKLLLWEDIPNNWGAWDVNHFYRETEPEQASLISRKVLQDTPFVKTIEQCFKVGNSEIIQRISLKNQSKLLLIENEVDWKEKHKMLRVSTETNIQASFSQAEVQFGLVQRPTHQNSSWDYSRFEIMAHRFIDLSQSDYGFAVLNDCKYGHSANAGTLDITLLRSPADVDPEADLHKHNFKYAYYPHIGDLSYSDTLQKAHNLNSDPLIYQISNNDRVKDTSFFSIEGKNVKIDTLKFSDLDNSLILRCYETMGTSVKANIKSAFEMKKAQLCNLLEDYQDDLAIKENSIDLSFKPFELKTIKLEVIR